MIEDVHEAIVSKQQWQTVQDIMDKHNKVRPSQSGYDNIFRRLLICPDCGQSMLLHTDGRNPNRPLGERSYFQCSTYRCYGKDKCTSHRISVNSLYDAVLKDIQYHARLAMDDPEGYVRQTLEHMDSSTAQRRDEIQREKTSLQAQNESLSQQFIRLYDDFSRGLVSERQYQTLSAHYESQQNDCERRIAELGQEQERLQAATVDVERFAKELAQYAGITQLTGTMLNLLLNKIEVHEAVEQSGKRCISLDIHYIFAV